MSTWAWFALGVGIAYFLVSWWYLASRIAWNTASSYQTELDGDDIAWGMIGGLVSAAFGIVIIPIVMIRDRSNGTVTEFFNRRLYKPVSRREVA